MTFTSFEGYVITSIDVERIPGQPKNRVQFHEFIKGDPNDDTACILKNVEYSGKRVGGKPWGAKIFHATKVKPSELQTQLRAKKRSSNQDPQVLLCVHGLSVQPETWLADCTRFQEKCKKYWTVIPVIWPGR